MSRHGRDPDEAERELLLRYGIEPNPHADHFCEQELADRIREQASLPPGHNPARHLARSRLPRSLRASRRARAALDACTRRGGHLPRRARRRARHGTVEQLLDDDQGAVAVRFENGERSAFRRGARAECCVMRGGPQRREPPAAFAYEPTHPPTIPPGLTVSDWRARRRKRPRRRR
jgi:hypothetical protein